MTQPNLQQHNSRSIEQALKDGVVIFDGAMGTELYRRHFFVNTSFENLVLTSPETVLDVHRKYAEAGADVMTTDTFSANRAKLRHFGLAEQLEAICRRAVELARTGGGAEALIAASVGPAGEDAADWTEEAVAELLEEPARFLAEAGADFILFESIPSVRDLRAATRAAQSLEIPYVLSMTLDGDGCFADGIALTHDMLREVELSSHAPVAWALNCGQGPESMLDALEKVNSWSKKPWVVQPNAGEPRRIDSRTMYMNSPEYYTTYALRYVNCSVRGVGGCCGIGPEHIREMAAAVRPFSRGTQRSLPEIPRRETSEVKAEIPFATRSAWARKLANGERVTSIEITPPKGFDLGDVVAKAQRCREAGIDAINLPDGPRASARISSLVTALEIQRRSGIEVVLHICARDRSLLALQADLLGCACEEIHNLLFITGDPPKLGDYPFSSGVFDVDSIGLCAMQKRLNQGLDLGGKNLGMQTAAAFGVGLDPNAVDQEREYRRICEKAEAGAEFIVTQPVFEPRALLDFLKRMEHLHLPVVAGVWPLASLRNAEFMKTEVPGVIVPDSIMKRMAEAGDKEAQRQCGIAIARESIAEIQQAVQGIQVSAPFGNVETAIAVLQK